MTMDVFSPKRGETVNIAATSSAASVTLSDAGKSSSNVRIYNAGPNIAFIRIGVGAQTADVTNSMPIPSGAVESFYKGQADTISAVCATGETAKVYFTPGEGQ
jgi:hypothetical protein